MASGLEDKWKNLMFTDAKEDTLVCEDEPDDLTDELVSHSLVGKLLTDTPFNPKALNNTMRNLWKPLKGLVVREIENSIFVFQFYSKLDREKVLEQGPWVARFWVKAYQLSVNKRKRLMAMVVANKMGTFVDFDELDPFSYKKYMRFRVDIDVSRHLMRGMKDCNGYDEDLPEAMYSYGGWLRASPTRNRGRNDVTRDSELKLLEELKKNISHSRAKQRLQFSDEGGSLRSDP
ncbi:Collagen alpha-1(XIV) chain [Bienertia sinuspersici]